MYKVQVYALILYVYSVVDGGKLWLHSGLRCGTQRMRCERVTIGREVGLGRTIRSGRLLRPFAEWFEGAAGN